MTIIIAEVGVNHNGSLDRALQLVDVAQKAGADVVKFQIFDPEKLVASNVEMAAYQKRQMKDESRSQRELLAQYTLPNEAFVKIKAYCDEVGIEFMATPFDCDAVSFLEPMVSRFKVASGDLTDLPLIRRIAKAQKPIILSTGMATQDEIELIVSEISRIQGTKDALTILHCVTDYPCAIADLNIRKMTRLAEVFGCSVGLSDHSEGFTGALAAVALGATVVEKHVTLDKSLPGPDHKASASPQELTELVTKIREVEQALGSDKLGLTDAERPNRAVARKRIVAATTISAGEQLTEKNMTTKRAGHGSDALVWDELIGKLADRNYQIDEPIEVR